MNFTRLKIVSLAVLLAFTGAGCNAIDQIVPDNTTEYRRAETMPPLDIPPDLSTEQINDEVAGDRQKNAATYSEYEEAANNPLASKYGVTPETKPSLSGEGENRHLVIPTEREETWQRLLDFWEQKSVEIKRKDLRIGLMDTDVGSDDYAYRLRVERGDTSKITLVYVGGTGAENNPQKNEAMLRQIADFLGALYQEDQQEIAEIEASQPQVASVKTALLDDAEGQQTLVVEQDYADVWNRVDRILDSKGFNVEDRDRSRGVYLVQYIDPFNKPEEEGWMDGVAFWRDDVEQSPEEYYYIKLISDAENTNIVILDAEEVRTSSDTARRLLALMQEQLSQ
jgi:outer membrane protein assembly factor BamC